LRTVRRCVRELNKEKQLTLNALTKAYANEKQYWLKVFEQKSSRDKIKRSRVIRDVALAAEYEPASNLQSRMWKLALNDAAETWDKYWEALFAKIRPRIAAHPEFNKEAKHYAFWILKNYKHFFECLSGKQPEPNFAVDEAIRIRVTRYLCRQVKRLRGRNPHVRIARSIVLDANCYSLFEEKGQQYLKIMTLEPGQRLVLPLLGKTSVAGNIRIVSDKGQVEVHLAQKMETPKIDEKGAVVAIDFGYTEAFTDNEGKRYGTSLGTTLTKASDQRNLKGKDRNKLRALAKKYAKSQSPRLQRKAKNIRRFNLGEQKWDEREQRAKATIACEINTGLNELIKSKKPAVIVTEELSQTFSYNKPKTCNRRLSAWTRGVIQDRVEFKALAEGFRHEQVNPAYSSQTCPDCGNVDSNNRKGDVFVCTKCRYGNHADWVGALNLLSRKDDSEITRYTPYREVKDILLLRFHRRLEAEGASALEATVPGRTPDTDSQRRDFPSTVTRRAKQNKMLKPSE